MSTSPLNSLESGLWAVLNNSDKAEVKAGGRLLARRAVDPSSLPNLYELDGERIYYNFH